MTVAAMSAWVEGARHGRATVEKRVASARSGAARELPRPLSGQLSGGQSSALRSRGRYLRAALILLDEPLAALDVELRSSAGF